MKWVWFLFNYFLLKGLINKAIDTVFLSIKGLILFWSYKVFFFCFLIVVILGVRGIGYRCKIKDGIGVFRCEFFL